MHNLDFQLTGPKREINCLLKVDVAKIQLSFVDQWWLR